MTTLCAQSRRRALATAALAALALSAEVALAAQPVRVVTSIPPLAMIVSELGGDRVLVHSILPPGADPHTFEPRPSDAVAVAEADIVVVLGSSIDDWIGDLIVAPDRTVVVRLDAEGGVKDGAEGGADDGDERGHDPHVWLDPTWVRDHALAPIHAALAAADPDASPRYGVAARAMAEQLADLEEDMRQALALASTRSFLAWHPAWEHFARRFGLHSVASVGEVEGREPSLRAMIGAVRAGRAAGVRAVLVEPQTDSRQAAVLAGELGVPLVTVDPLGDAWSLDRATYRNLMLFNVWAFARALAVENDEKKEEGTAPAAVSSPAASPASP